MTTPISESVGVRVLKDAARILVLGCPGSGKSTLSGRLGELRGLPTYALDELYFGPNWTEPTEQDWRQQVRALCDRESWIVDGNHASTLRDRLPRASAVIIIDRHPVWCLAGYLGRLLRYRRTPISDLPHYMQRPDGGRRTADKPLSFAWFILRFRSRVLPGMVAVLDTAPNVRVIRLGDRGAIRRLLRALSESDTAALDSSATGEPRDR